MNTRSNLLTQYIHQQIDEHGGQISFADFMRFALYHPELGYYNAKEFDLGIHGDFTTAPEISPLFAHCFARQYLQLCDHLNDQAILELGAGTGRFAKDLLLELEKIGHLPNAYYIYEPSIGLRKKQQIFLQTSCPTFFSRIQWLDHLPKNFSGMMIANEVLDALPVHCFHIDGNAIKERCVTWDEDNFTWTLSLPSKELLEKVTQIYKTYHLYSGYESEINLALPAFIQTISRALSQGVIFFIDYGYGREEYYHRERKSGTLTCFYQHRSNDNPLIFPGLQDITAHVDFTWVVENAVENECQLLGYTTQAAFLLACGLLELAEEKEKLLSAIDAFQMHQAIKLLTLPTEMGERIKVMALGKNMELPLMGFKLQDRRRDL